MAGIYVEINDAALRRRLARISSPAVMEHMNRQIGVEVVERLKDFIAEMSVTHHKTADRLGAKPTRYFENAPGRTVLKEADANGATVSVLDTAGLERAYHDLDITPKKARALTIPLSRVSYGKRVADLERRGHKVFRPKGTNILAEAKGKKGGIRPLYALVKSVHIPRDKSLMPGVVEVFGWAKDAVENYVETWNVLGDDLMRLTARADSIGAS